jgi:hypothetical protein
MAARQDPVSGHTSELTWYSRFAVLVGAAVLLLQSVTDRGAGPVSLIAVLLMAGGLPAFITGLIWDARTVAGTAGAQPSVVEEDSEIGVKSERAEPEIEELDALPPGDSLEGIEPDSDVSSEAEGPAATSLETAPPVETSMTAPVEVPQSPIPSKVQLRVRTEEIAEDNRLAQAPCVHCRLPLGARAVVAFCPVCERPQHAACWIDNHFRCSTPGCTGRGSLEAPSVPGEE